MIMWSVTEKIARQEQRENFERRPETTSLTLLAVHTPCFLPH